MWCGLVRNVVFKSGTILETEDGFVWFYNGVFFELGTGFQGFRLGHDFGLEGF